MILRHSASGETIYVTACGCEFWFMSLAVVHELEGCGCAAAEKVVPRGPAP